MKSLNRKLFEGECLCSFSLVDGLVASSVAGRVGRGGENSVAGFSPIKRSLSIKSSRSNENVMALRALGAQARMAGLAPVQGLISKPTIACSL